MKSDNVELIERFRAAARKFIEEVDSAPQIDTEPFLANVGRSMAELYWVALTLPDVQPETDGTDETPFQTETWGKLRHSLQEKIGPLDTYWEIFDSTEKQEPVQGSLAGDISEIGLTALDGSIPQRAITQRLRSLAICFRSAHL